MLAQSNPDDPTPDDAVALYLAEVERQCAADPALSTVAAGILAGQALDIAHDSRGFSRLLGIEHALVLREVELLADRGRLLVTRRDERTRRTCYASAPAQTRTRTQTQTQTIPAANDRA